MTSPKLFRRLTVRDDPSITRRVLAWLYLSNGVLGLVLLVWFVVTRLWSAETMRATPLGYTLALGALGVWSLSNLWIGLQLREGSRRGVITGVALNVGSALATLPAPSEAPVAVGVSVLAAIALAMVWRELAPRVTVRAA